MSGEGNRVGYNSSSGSGNGSVPLIHLPLRLSSLTTLQRRGFVTVGDLEQALNIDGGIERLASELNVTAAEAYDLFQQVQDCLFTSSSGVSGGWSFGNGTGCTTALSARDLLNQTNKIHKHNRFIVTFCKTMDFLLGGGIELAQVTEIAGLPGVGKTQLAMQLCVDAHIPKLLGGVQGQAVYIDSEGSFSPQRCHTMAQALVQHMQASVQRQQRRQQQQIDKDPTALCHHHRPTPGLAALPTHFTPEHILSGIHVYRVHSEPEQTSTIYSLSRFLEEQQGRSQQDSRISPIKLIVIDSIAFHYRAGVPDNALRNSRNSDSNPNMPCKARRQQIQESKNFYIQRTKALTTLAAVLGELAATFDVAVVAINHMTTKFVGDSIALSSSDTAPTGTNSDGDFTSMCVPALGESWAHATTTRMLLSSSPSPVPANPKKRVAANRMCTLVKSPHRPAGIALFQIVKNGIRDVSGADKEDSRPRHANHEEQLQQPPQRTFPGQSQDIELQFVQQPQSQLLPPPQEQQSQSLPPTLPRSVTPAQDHFSRPGLISASTPTVPTPSMSDTLSPQQGGALVEVTGTSKRIRTNY
jgi:RAD51-like protein 2